ncbi:hypothetical protein Barb6XT_00277 [Bacteroidales bacterium Barb6XT]|nr:hypothetical protein Barb6XT_00277 [Bacteroidales bacterium Barb6XT]
MLKDRIYSLAGTIVFHAIILLVLWFTVLKSKVPEEQGGVWVNFGNADAAAGTFEPNYTEEETIPVPPAPEPAPVLPQEKVITQNTEESVALAKAKKKEDQRKKREAEEAERKRREEAERRRIAEAQRRKKEKDINNRVAGAFGIGNAKGTSQGDADKGAGNQGNPFGNAGRGTGEGNGGEGTFSLNGRSIGPDGLPRPAYTIQEEGKIVIDITVDPKGNVIFAEIGRGTDIGNDSMRRSAREAARRAKFNSITGSNNQRGTITYVYRFK